MAVSCPEVMYGAYYPYLYGRAGPSRSFYQYERVSANRQSGIRITVLQNNNTIQSIKLELPPQPANKPNNPSIKWNKWHFGSSDWRRSWGRKDRFLVRLVLTLFNGPWVAEDRARLMLCYCAPPLQHFQVADRPSSASTFSQSYLADSCTIQKSSSILHQLPLTSITHFLFFSSSSFVHSFYLPLFSNQRTQLNRPSSHLLILNSLCLCTWCLRLLTMLLHVPYG